MDMRVKIESVYGAAEFEHTTGVEVAPFPSDWDLDDNDRVFAWFCGELFQWTRPGTFIDGAGKEFSDVEGSHRVSVVECEQQPELVGKCGEWISQGRRYRAARGPHTGQWFVVS